MDEAIHSQARVHVILGRIKINNSFTHAIPDLKWEVREVLEEGHNDTTLESCYRPIGWHVNYQYRRPDTFTGVIGIGRGRREFIAYGSAKSTLVKTAWLLLELLVRHELMEAFEYDGVRIFNPHHTVDNLTRAAEEWAAEQRKE